MWYAICFAIGAVSGVGIASLAFSAGCNDCQEAMRYREDLLSLYAVPGCILSNGLGMRPRFDPETGESWPALEAAPLKEV